MSTEPVDTESIDQVIDRLTRTVPDWPEPGVTFRDLTPVLADADAFAAVADACVGSVHGLGTVDAVVGVESRGFWLGPALALRIGVGFVPVRKAGKLPGPVHAAEYSLEYGTATLEVPEGLIEPGQQIVIVDDVLATGGTLDATRQLIDDSQATVLGALVLIELAALGGRARLDPMPVVSLASY